MKDFVTCFLKGETVDVSKGSETLPVTVHVITSNKQAFYEAVLATRLHHLCTMLKTHVPQRERSGENSRGEREREKERGV